MRPLFFLFCLLCFVSVQAQSYSGYVFDKITKDTIVGASVYFDGTSIGTTTDEYGFFQIESKEKINTPLLISYVGYATFKVDDSALGGITHIYLKEDQLNLNEVVVYDDTWSRERKMKHFKKEFLGQGKGGRKSRIKNEYAIKLRFNQSDSTLVAFSNEPILVENQYLGYLVSFRVKEFRIQFRSDYKAAEGLRASQVYLNGNSFFTDLPNITPKKNRARKRSYLSSLPRVMRSIRNGTTHELGYSFYGRTGLVPPEQFVIKEEVAGKTLYSFKEQQFYIRDIFGDNSLVRVKDRSARFEIDAYGNHSPWDKIVFADKLGLRRVGDMLPLDYYPFGSINGKEDYLP